MVNDDTQSGICNNTGYISATLMSQGNWLPVISDVAGRYFPPESAVAGGYDADATPLYVCRGMRVEGSIQPGSFRLKDNVCATAYGDQQETLKPEFLVTSWEGNIWDASLRKWLYTAGEVPQNAVQGGYEASGKPLYYCSARIGTSWQPGKINEALTGCNVPYDGKEVSVSRYQVLVIVTPAMPLITVSGINGTVPADAVRGGTDIDGENLYLCNAD